MSLCISLDFLIGDHLLLHGQTHDVMVRFAERIDFHVYFAVDYIVHVAITEKEIIERLIFQMFSNMDHMIDKWFRKCWKQMRKLWKRVLC